MTIIRIAVVCVQGLGTSMWLKGRVEDWVQRKGLTASIIQTDISSCNLYEPDIIVGSRIVVQSLAGVYPQLILLDNLLDPIELEQKLINVPSIAALLQSGGIQQ